MNIGLIIVVVYIIGIFITPIILKKFKFFTDNSYTDQVFIVPITSLCWPLSIFIGLICALIDVIMRIYNKV